MSTPRTGWEDILEEGELIVWQGRPHSRVIWSDLLSFETFFGLFFAGFSLFWIAGAWMMTSGLSTSSAGGVDAIFSFFPLFGLPFLAVGVYLVAGRIFWDAYQRRRTWYTLTNRAAYIARQTFGKRSLKRYDMVDMNSPDLQDGSPGSVFFAKEVTAYQTRSRHGRRRTRTRLTPIGFRQIDDARKVYRLIVDHHSALKP